MPTFQTDIFNTVLRAKCTASCWVSTIIQKEKYGQDIECCELKLMLLVRWIHILEAFYFEYFSGEVFDDTPDTYCLTEDEGSELLAKLKVLIKTPL